MKTIITALALLSLVTALAGCGGAPALSASEQAAYDGGYDDFYAVLEDAANYGMDYDPYGDNNTAGVSTGQFCWDGWYSSDIIDTYIDTAAGEIEADVPDDSPYWDDQFAWQNGCDAAEEDYLADA